MVNARIVPKAHYKPKSIFRQTWLRICAPYLIFITSGAQLSTLVFFVFSRIFFKRCAQKGARSIARPLALIL